MEKKITNEFQKKKYGTALKCRTALLNFRMGTERVCFNPRCKASIDKYYSPLPARKAFICRRCLGHFYPMAGSIFGNTHIDEVHLFEIAYLMLSSRNGIAAKEVERMYGYGYPAIHRLMHLIRSLMGQCLEWSFDNDAVLEIDESFVKTGNKGLGRHHHFKPGRGSEKHSTILVIAERVGKAKLYVIPSADAETIIPLLEEQIDKSSLLITDDWSAYNGLKARGYSHIQVNHNEKDPKFRYKNGMASTNTAENIFSNLKRSIKGTYRSTSRQYLQYYLNEYAFRHSFRNEPDYGFSILMQNLGSLSEYYAETSESHAA